jgi:hypothetical protein
MSLQANKPIPNLAYDIPLVADSSRTQQCSTLYSVHSQSKKWFYFFFLLLVVGSGQHLLTTARRTLVKSRMLQGGPCLKDSFPEFCSSLPDLEKRPTGHRSLLAANGIQSDQMDQMTEFRMMAAWGEPIMRPV